jgi:hypothetical protein
MRIAVSSLALAAALIAAAPASAATFLFTYSGTNATNGAFTATGTITTTNTTTLVNGRAAYTITGITGTRNGSAITGLVPAGTDFGGVAIDNYLYASTPFLTDAGFGFTVAGTTNLYNPYYFSGAYQEYVRTAAGADFQNTSGVTFTLTQVGAAVPEPATWGMMILGFGMIGAASRSRKVKTSVKFA